MANETPVVSGLFMDRSDPVGNSADTDGRRRLHTKITNSVNEPVYTDLRPLVQARVTTVQLNSSAWVPLPSQNLPNRHSVTIQNTSTTKNILVNYTTSVPLTEGFIIWPQSAKELVLSDSMQIYGVMESGATGIAVIEEVGQ
jgi:hypothetical protein